MKKILDAIKWVGIVGGLGVWAWLGWVTFSNRSHADDIVIPNTFSVGQVADPAQVNANFDAIKNVVNGKIDDDNWDTSGPQLSCTNLNITTPCIGSTFILDGSIINADVNASAAILGSKLDLANDIVTGDIVNGTIDTADLSATTIANLDNQVFVTTNPSDVASQSCVTGWTDVTGASWTVTAAGATIVAVFDATVKLNGTIADLDFRLVIDGVNGPAFRITGNTIAEFYTIGLNAHQVVSSGSRTIKVQCRDGDTDNMDIASMQVTISEL